MEGLIFTIPLALVIFLGVKAGEKFGVDRSAECIRHQEWCAAEEPRLYEALFDGEK